MDLRGWKFKITFGFNCDVYSKGKERVMIDRRTGGVVIRYTMKERLGEMSCM